MTFLFYGMIVNDVRSREKEQSMLLKISSWTIISGLGFLSLALHQEPRFLMPILVPLAIILGEMNFLSSKKLRLFWIAFNVILLVVFGILHQGGLIPSMLSNQIIQGKPRSIQFFHTYMPPSFLSRRWQCNSLDDHEHVCPVTSCPQPSTQLFRDLMGSSSESDLTVALQRELHCEPESKQKESGNFAYLVTSPHVFESGDAQGSTTKTCKEVSCESIVSFWPHLSTEDFPLWRGSISDYFQSFILTIYKIRCT